MKKIFTLFLLYSQVCFAQVVDSKVISFTLVNSETGKLIRTLSNGSVINLDVDGYKLNIKANITLPNGQAVNFNLKGAQTHVSSDNKEPYSLYGDKNGDYNAWTPSVGNYELKATPTFKRSTLISATISFSVIKNPPPKVTVNQASNQIDPAASSPVLFTATFSETVTGFSSADVVLGGTAGATTKVVTGGPSVYTISVSGITKSGTVTAAVPAGVANDAGGRPNTVSTSTDNTVTFNYTAPDPAPTVTVNQASNQIDPAASSPVLFTATFSEAVTGFSSADVVLGGTAGATTKVVTGGPSVYTISVSGITKSGTVTATIPAAMANDAGGKPNTVSTSTDNVVTFNYTAPDPAPTVTVNQASNQIDPATGSPVLFTATFSEAVTGFSSADVVLGGTAGATTKVVTGGPSVYTISVSGITKSGTVTATIPAAMANDAGGKPNTASTSTDNTVTFNYTAPDPAPTVTINQASNQIDPATSSPVLFTATFSEAVTGFSSADVVLGGTAGATTKVVTGGPSVYTISVSGITKSGTVTATIPAAMANDAGGKPNTASTSTDNTVTFNYTAPDPAPTVTVNQASNQIDPATSSPVLFTATFSEAVTGFSSADVILGGTAGATTKVVTGGPSVYTISVSGITKSGTVTATIPAAMANDAGGKPNTVSTSTDNTVTFNYTAPDPAPTVTVNQASNQIDPAASSPVLFTATFSEAVTGFSSADVVLGGTAGATTKVVTGGPSVYTISVSGITKSGTVTATIPAAMANDAGGKPNTVSTSTDNTVTFNYTAPDPAPTVTVNQASNQIDPAASSPVLFTATFSEAVTGFSSADVVLGGTAGATTKVVTGGPSVYTISVSGITKSGTVTATIPAGLANDAGGKPNTASTSTDNTVTFNYTAPDPAPTVTLNQASNQIDPAASSPVLFTATFSEVVTGFSSADVVLGGTAGAITKVVTGGPSVYTISVSGITKSGTVTATIPAGVVNDAGGKPNAACTITDNTVTFNYTAPDPAPTVTINQASNQIDPATSSPVLFTATFSEVVTGFSSADVVLGGTAGAITKVVTGGPSVYTISVSGITKSGTVTATIPAGVVNDAGGKPNAACTITDNTVTFNYTAPDPAPTVTINQASNQIDPAASSPVLFTATFSEAVTGFSSADVVLGGTAGATTKVVTGGPSVYTISVSGITKSGTVTATIPAAMANDAGGKPNTLSTSTDNTVTFNYTAPDPAPTVTINQASNQIDPAASNPVLFTATFSEAVTGFSSADVVLGGTAGATTKVVTGGPSVYTISVSGITKSGTVTATIPAAMANDAGGKPNTASTSTDNTVTFNYTAPDPAPTVAVNQASNQIDPAASSPVLFTATFSEAVTGFSSADVVLGGTAGATTKVVTGGPSVYTISVSGITKSGTVTATIPAAMANDAGGKPNTASTSTDNTITYNYTAPDPAPTVTINQASNQIDPAASNPVLFTATFSETVTGFSSADVVLGGTAGATTKVVTGGPSVYTISVSGITTSGSVTATVPAGVANDAGGKPNTASTSTDNVVACNITVTPPTGGGYYASPTGTGSGTFASPFRIADFWKVAKAGDILNLLDGHYTGASSMINPPQNLSGTATARITIRAVNDGKVDIDGERANIPCRLEYNNYFQLEGLNIHHSPFQSSVITVVNSNYNIFKRIIGWETSDGNVNIWNLRASSNNLVEDCAGWGQARKIFGATQRADNNIFRRCFGRWEGSIVIGPKKVFTLSYNSYNNMAENCVGTWDAMKMPATYTLRNYDYTINTDENNGSPTEYTNYQVHQPGGIFGNDGFDPGPTVTSDIADIRTFGCIAFLKQNQRFHNAPNRGNAGPYAFNLKGTYMQNCVSYIEPGPNHSYIQSVNFESTDGTAALNTVSNLTRVGGVQQSWTIGSPWAVTKMLSSPDCSVIKANGGSIVNPLNTSGAVIEKRYVNGVLTNENLWPWPMNQRIIDAMVQGGYAPYDVTKEVFGLCGNTPPSQPSVDIVAVAKKWLASSGSSRDSLEAVLDSWTGNIDSVIQKVKPVPTDTQKGQVFYQSFTNPVFRQRYPDHQFHMYVPNHYTTSKPIGVMIWLHGGGSWDATNIDHLATYEMDNEQVTGRSYARTETDNSNYILVAPIAPFGPVIPHPQHASRWNVPNADQYLMDIITDISTRYNVDYNRIVVAGFSMGGIGAFHQALRLNDRLSAVMASGGSWTLGSWDGLKNMPMYIIQGVNDAHYYATECRPHNTAIEYARIAHNFLYKSSNIHRLCEYPGEHGWDASGQLYWKTFLSGQEGWVTDKVRNPYRSNVTAVNPWRSYDVDGNYGVTWTENPSPHTMWVSIKQTGTGTIPYDYAREEGTGGCSSLADFNNWSLTQDTKNMPGGKAEANITGPNQVVITSTNVTKMSLWLHPNMVNFNNPVNVTLNGVTKSFTLKPSLLTALKSYERRWDWGMIYHAEIDIN